MRNDLQALKELIAKGVDVDAYCEWFGRTALWYAVSENYVKCATALLDAKADVHKADRHGETPLHAASYSGKAECVRLLIQRKANVNALNNRGYSPLHNASNNGHLTCVQILVTAGAEMDRLNNYGYTPLVISIRCDYRNVAQFLLHSGAKMNNVLPYSEIPIWMIDIIQKRCTVMNSTLVLKGVLKWRLGIYKDVTHLISLYFWRIRLNYFTSSNTL
jgi:ankyrin repeat protein